MKQLLFASFTLLFTLPAFSQKAPHQILIEAKIIEVGKYDLYLPDDIRPGDLISFSSKIIADGDKPKEINKNLASLNSNTISLGSHNFTPGTSGQKLNLSEQEFKNLSLLVKNTAGKTLYEAPIDLSNLIVPLRASSTFALPTHALAGGPFRVTGPFDGNAENTKCTINNKEAVILAESPRQCIIEFPKDVKGSATITITEGGKTITQNINGVDYTIAAGKMNLLKGESTYIDVKISNLQNLQENATLSLENLTTGVVVMAGGNVQVIPILPESVSGVGTFYKRFTIQSLKTGTFTINVDLQLPDAKQSAVTPASSWVACDVCGGTIMPQKTCNSIKELLKNKLPVQQIVTQDTIPGGWLLSTSTTDKIINIKTETVPSNNVSMVEYSYSTPQQSERHVIGIDSFPGNSKPFSLPQNSVQPGVYNIHATAYTGNNYAATMQQSVVIPSINFSGITNPLINEYRRRIQRVKDSIDNLQRIIDNDNRRNYDNYPERRRLDSVNRVKTGYYNELVYIDAVLETLPKVYGDTLTKLADSLKRFQIKVPELPDVDELKKRVADLEAALKACQEHLQSLQQEQKDLQKELPEVEQQQSDAVQTILDCFKNAGYDYAGHTSRKDGVFGYGYAAVKNGVDVGGIPAQCLKTVSEAKNKIKDLQKRHDEIAKRLKDIPAEIDAAKADCDRLSKELRQANESLRKGKNAIIEYGFINADMAEICRQLRGALDVLVRFCKQHPEVCNADNMVEQMMADCPQPKVWEDFNRLVNYKKGMEDGIKKQADDAQRQVDKNWEEQRKISEEAYRAKQEQDRKAAELQRLIQKEEQETEKELEKQTQRDDSARAIRRRDCEEFLKTQAKTKEEAGMIETVLKLKKQIQKLGGNVKKASEYGDKLTKDRYKDITDSLRSIIDGIIGPLKQYDKFKKEVDKWLEVKDDLEKIFSETKNERDRTEKFKIILKRIHEQLEKLAEDFPILKLFTAYFGYLVDSYSWAIDKSYETQQHYFNRIFEDCLGHDKCRILVNEYLKRKNLDDVYRKGWQLCKGDDLIDPILGTSERRRIAMEELQSVVLKLLTDCCIEELGL